MPTLIVIGGPTASGKTAAAIELAEKLQTEIISTDSRQFYREMSIGTAKPTREELSRVKHHFINHLSITDPYSVGDFEKDALAVLAELFQQYDTVVATGGSGLYIRALCEGLDAFPEISADTKKWLSAGVETGGLAWLQSELKARDPEYFAEVDQQNPARLSRALAVCVESGLPFSQFKGREKLPRNFQVEYRLLAPPREELYARINARVDKMIEAGLETEALSLLPYRALPALNTVGYEEMFDYFDGKISLETAIDKIRQHTRNYAKRQMTWFRKYFMI